MICPDCKNEVDLVIHEATGEKILFVKDNPNVVHNCKPFKYWCFKCEAGIRYDRPCIHRQIPTHEKSKAELEYY